MNFDVLLTAENPVPVHAILAIFALVAGAVQFVLPKGTFVHRGLGYVWVVAMLVVAISSFFINDFRIIGPFSPIHLLSCLVIYSLWHAVQYARRGNITGHKRTMVSLYCYSLLLAGAFTFLPGRIMYQVLFG